VEIKKYNIKREDSAWENIEYLYGSLNIIIIVKIYTTDKNIFLLFYGLEN
jgi:hypothetical protein